MKIEVVGPGCSRCKATEKNVIEAIKQLGIDVEVTHFTDVSQFAKKGVTFTPAVVVDGQVKISGKVPTVEEIKNVLSTSR